MINIVNFCKYICLDLAPKYGLWTKLSLLFLAWILIPVAPVQAKDKTNSYRKTTVVNFDESVVEGKGRTPYSSYLFEKSDGRLDDFSTWKPDWRNRVRITRARIK